MKRTKLTNEKEEIYELFKELYSRSFPVFEQRTQEQQERAIEHPNYHIIGYEEPGVFVGFIAYWEFDSYVYIEHLAINQSIRGKGYGSTVLQEFIHSTSPKIVLLEIDPIVDDVSAARLRFYTKNGFYPNPYPHTHPPYRNGYNQHPLIVLTTTRKITEEEYQKFNQELTEIVMNGPSVER